MFFDDLVLQIIGMHPQGDAILLLRMILINKVKLVRHLMAYGGGANLGYAFFLRNLLFEIINSLEPFTTGLVERRLGDASIK